MVKEGYRFFALRDSVTTSRVCSKGYGSRLLEFVEEVARRENCKVVALSSGLERTDAHRFYQKQMNYDKTSYVFKKTVL